MLTDAVLITMYAALAIPIVVITVSLFMHSMRQRLSKPFLGISACLFGWFFVTFAYHIATNPKLLEYLDNLTFVFMAFLPVILLMLVLRFYRHKRTIRPKAMMLLCIIPVITAIISIVPPLNWLLRTNYVMLQISPLHIADYEWNLWFYVHTIYSYLMVLASGWLVIRQNKKQPAEYKLPSALLIVSLIVMRPFPNCRTEKHPVY